jgi:formate C-acetyltransferase
MTKRTESYRQMMYDAPYSICIERAKYYTESYKETEGEHPAIRQAKALEKTLDKIPLYILDQEQMLGHRTSKLLGVILPVERGDVNCVLKMDLQGLKTRENKPWQISEEDENILMNEILPYWEGKTVCDKKIEMFKKYGLISRNKLAMKTSGRMENLQKFLLSNMPHIANTVLDDQGHMVMGHNNMVEWGINGIKERASQKLDEVNKNLKSNTIERDGGSMHMPVETVSYMQNYPELANIEHKFQERFSKGNDYTIDNKAFLEAVIILCDACTSFIKRYAHIARDKARSETNSQRKAELETAAEICDWISANTPRNFREALQLVWFNEIIGIMSHGLGAILAVGRPDQYLYPFYKAEIDAGEISNEEVIELLEEFIIKLSSNLMMLPGNTGKATPELGTDHVALVVGGVDKDGKDGTNELSYLFVDAVENVKCMTISFSIRIAPGVTSRKWLERAIEIYTKTSGTALYNDDVIVAALQNAGCSLEDARDYGIVGCIEPAPQGNAFPITAGNAISLPGLLEMTLNNGRRRLGGKIDGVRIGKSKEFKSYEEVWNAFLKLMKIMIDLTVKSSNIKDMVHAENYPNPFISMTTEGCIDNAIDLLQGGAKYNFNTISSGGFATVADSLYALKKIVFEDKELRMEEMLDILKNNFKKQEALRAKLKNKIPKFGNDHDGVDSIAQDLLNAFCEEVLSHSTIRLPGRYRPSLFSAGTHPLVGRYLGATPDGRKSGESVSNSLSPTNNTEKNGPTAVLNSLAKLDSTKIASGMSLNMRLLPLLLKDPENRSKLTDMVSTYFEKGGMHVQFNVVNQEDLIDAQAHPENYQDLVIRVSGYNAYFVNLTKTLQDDIIDRYQFENL